MGAIVYSDGLRSLLSSFALAYNETQSRQNHLETMADVLRSIEMLDDEALETIEILSMIDLRPLANDSYPDFADFDITQSVTSRLSHVELVPSKEGRTLWQESDWRMVPLICKPTPSAHYSPLGSPDYILDFKCISEDGPRFIALEVWSVEYRWHGIAELRLTPKKLIGQMAITPAFGTEHKSGKKPWRFNQINPQILEYTVTEAIYRSQQYTVCDRCSQVCNKLSFSGSGSCDQCLGIIH